MRRDEDEVEEWDQGPPRKVKKEDPEGGARAANCSLELRGKKT